jgi:hypothetical protein
MYYPGSDKSPMRRLTLILPLLLVLVTACSSTWRKSSIQEEGFRDNSLFVLVTRPLYALPFRESDEDRSRIREMADRRAILILKSAIMAGTLVVKGDNEQGVILSIVQSGKQVESRCDDVRCYWWFRYPLRQDGSSGHE